MKKFVPFVLVCLLATLVLAGTASASTLTLAKLAKQVAALQKKVKTQATTIASQGATIATLQGKLTADEETIAGQGTKISGLAVDLASAQSLITALQNSQTTGVSTADFNALAAKVTTDEGNIPALQSSVSGLNTQVGNQASVLIALANIVGQDASSGLRGTVAAHTTALNNAAPVLAIAPYVSLKTGTLNGVVGPNIVFQGANVHVRSTTSETDTTGTGNLIVGWDENPTTTPAGYRSGSNNLVCGNQQEFSKYGGFVAGYANGLTDAYATVAGGSYNNASGYCATVSGGNSNLADAAYSAVSGGASNYAGSNGVSAVVSGGRSNGANGYYAVVSAGQSLTNIADYGWMHP
jgi:hypothetical protein